MGLSRHACCAMMFALWIVEALVIGTRERTTNAYRIGSPLFGAATAAESRTGAYPGSRKLLVQGFAFFGAT